MTAFIALDGPSTRRRKVLTLMTASLVSSMIMLDSNIVAVSLPAIARSLGATFADVEWVVSAYVLSFAALLLAAGAFADLRGRRLAALLGLGIFAIASALCGFAVSAAMLNWSRALQGVGASLLLTSALAIINNAFQGAERARAYAFWGACLGIAITCGPIAGGVITDRLGWHWAFLINLPVCVGLMIATATVIEESRDHEAKRLDGWGVATFSVGLFLLTWALIDGNALGWTSREVIWRLSGATVLLVAFLIAEMVQARPMVDLALFRRPTFVGAAIAMVGYAAGAQVLIFYLPLFLQNAYALTPTAAGLAMLPFALPMFAAPRIGACLARHRSGRALLGLGLGIVCAGDLFLAWFAVRGWGYPAFAAGMLVAGGGAGLLNSETTKVMQGTVPPQRAGMVSGLSATTRFTGLLLGVAGLGVVLARGAAAAFAEAATPLGLDREAALTVAKRLSAGDAVGAVSTLPESVRAAAEAAGRVAFAQGFGEAALTAALAAGASCLLTMLLVSAVETAPTAPPASPHPSLYPVR